jgi:hypothetical protein
MMIFCSCRANKENIFRVIDVLAFFSIRIGLSMSWHLPGKTYRDDLIILPDGNILKPWWRKQGHQLTVDDLQELIDSSPEIIVVGTGVNGRVIPVKNLKADLAKMSIEFIAVPNEEAIKVFNQLVPEKRIGGGFHLTC